MNRIKGYCIVSAFTVVLYLGLSHLGNLSGVFRVAIGMLMPFVIGVAIAFILNGVMRVFEEKVFVKLGEHKNPRRRALVRPLSLVSTYLLMLGGLAVLIGFVAPQLGKSVKDLGEVAANVPGYLQAMGDKFTADWVIPQPILDEISAAFSQVASRMLDFVVKFIPDALGLLATLGGGIITFIIGIIVSIHILLTKEKLMDQMSRLNRAFLPNSLANGIGTAAKISADTFANYVSGQLLDALIVGVVSVIGLSAFRFPYAMLIGVIMGVTNVIPYFGPFIGAVPGFFIIVMIDPVKALWYIAFVVLVQQVDGNFIAPKIIGGSVGLPPLWVLFAVTVGGGLFGVAGMVLGTPVFATLYILLGRATRAREAAHQPRKKT